MSTVQPSSLFKISVLVVFVTTASLNHSSVQPGSISGLKLLFTVNQNKCKKLKQFKTRCKDDMVNSDN